MHNPFAQPKLPMQRSFYGAEDVLAMIDMALEDLALGSSRNVNSKPCLHIIYEDADEEEITERLARMEGFAKFTCDTERLADINWAAKMQEDFPAFRVGAFYVHGSHIAEPVPHNTLPLRIDAAAAFGTGEHATTAGCLLAIERLRHQYPDPKRVLDMGCGTAILALGAARLWKRAKVDAVDNDLAAVRVSEHNIAVNQLSSRIRTWRSDGPNHRRLKKTAPYEVVIANILALPLMNMARDLSTFVAPGGALVLSGLLEGQIRMVLSAYHMQGLRLTHRHVQSGWAALTLQKA